MIEAVTASSETNSAIIRTSAARSFATGFTRWSGARVGAGSSRSRSASEPQRSIGEGVLERPVVRRDADAATVVAQRRQQVDELAPRPPVLAERRLVEHEQAGRRGEGGRHRQPSLLAAGEREGIRLGEVGEPQPLEELVRARGRLAGGRLPRAAARGAARRAPNR